MHSVENRLKALYISCETENTLDQKAIMLTAFLHIKVHLTTLCINQQCRLPATGCSVYYL